MKGSSDQDADDKNTAVVVLIKLPLLQHLTCDVSLFLLSNDGQGQTKSRMIYQYLNLSKFAMREWVVNY